MGGWRYDAEGRLICVQAPKKLTDKQKQLLGVVSEHALSIKEKIKKRKHALKIPTDTISFA